MHIPVLLQEVLQYLNVQLGQKFIDATLGGGGHTQAILENNSKTQVLAIDWDQTSLEKFETKLVQSGLAPRCRLAVGNYKDIDRLAQENGFGPVDGILLDLGFSSLQLDDPERGFSFQSHGPLDMRYSKANRLTARTVVNHYQQKDLERIIREFGEEHLAKAMSRAIVEARQVGELSTTDQLAVVITKVLPGKIRHKAQDSLRRVFQAIRIEVNSELSNIKTVLPKALDLLAPKGRLVVISFHSLEDRIVKEFFKDQAKDCVCPPEFPTCVCDKASRVRILTRKPVTASEEEGRENPRSKSAKLRAIEKI